VCNMDDLLRFVCSEVKGNFLKFCIAVEDFLRIL
jgi:hypothetical protein